MTDSRSFEANEVPQIIPEGVWVKLFKSNPVSDSNGSIVESRPLENGGTIHIVVQSLKLPDAVRQMVPSKLLSFQLEQTKSPYEVYAINSSRPDAIYRAETEKSRGKIVLVRWHLLGKSGDRSPFHVPENEIDGLKIMVSKTKQHFGEGSSWQ